MRPPARCRSRQEGQALLEFALGVSLMAMLLVGASDFPRAFYFDVVATGAAMEGARAAASGAPDAAVIAAAQNSAPTGVGPALAVTVSPPPAQRTAGVSPVWTTVTVTYRFQPITPLASALTGPHYTITRGASQWMRTPCAQANGSPC